MKSSKAGKGAEASAASVSRGRGRGRGRGRTGAASTTAPVMLKRPAAASVVSKRPKMPDAGSVEFLCGRVSHSNSKNGWRVWPNVAKRGAEKTVPYGDSPDKAFQAALNIIQNYVDATSR